MAIGLLEPFAAAFILALVSEIADKTQFVILGLALQYRSPWQVFAGALIAHAIMDGLAILLGAYLGFSLPFTLIKTAIGIIFILFGVGTLAKIYLFAGRKKQKKEISTATVAGAFVTSFLTVLLSEFGDKTQIASGLLSARYLAPLPIFVGFVAALAVAIGLNVFIGSKVAERLPQKTIKFATAVLFILFGLFTLLF